MTRLATLTHDTGDLTEYSSTVVDGGDLSVATAAALAGTSHGLQVVVDDTTAIYGQKDITASALIRFRFYIDPNSATPIGCNCVRLHSGGTYRAAVYFYEDSGYKLTPHVSNDAGTDTWGVDVSISDAPHWVECEWKASTGAGANNGYFKLWVDKNSGAADSEVTSVDNDTHTANGIRVGAPSAVYGAGTFYLDQVIVNNDGGTIGALAVKKLSAQTRAVGKKTAGEPVYHAYKIAGQLDQ